MKAAVAKKSSEASESLEKRGPHSIPLNDREEKRLKDLMMRYQEAVVLKNKQAKEKRSANVNPCDIMRAGMMALQNLSDEDFRLLVLNARERQ